MRSTELEVLRASNCVFIVILDDGVVLLPEVLVLAMLADVEAEDHPALDARLDLTGDFTSEAITG